MATRQIQQRTNDAIRYLILKYFYDRNNKATSISGKNGSESTIMIIRKELKIAHGLSVQEVMRNLRYLISQGWVSEKEVRKNVPLRSGTVIPSSTKYYGISATGIDKIEGPSAFTPDPFQGIKIEATGQSIVTVGNGNYVNSIYKDLGSELALLADTIKSSDAVDDTQKLNAVADVQAMQAQLAKPEPNQSVLRAIWSGLSNLATVDGLASLMQRVGGLLLPLIGSH